MSTGDERLGVTPTAGDGRLGVTLSAGDDRLGVTPTPDTGERLSSVRLWDEAARPAGPQPPPDARYTAPGCARRLTR